MTTQDAIRHFGSGPKLAAAMHIKSQAIYQWGEYPPYARQCQIQVLTNGALKAERVHQKSA